MCTKVSKLDKFISKANEVHGNKYDYSLVEYKNVHTKVKITCNEHGVFEQTPSTHLYQKSGCPRCGGNAKLNLNEFIDRSNQIHDNKYDYSLVEYKNVETKVKIICPVHGVFEQEPKSHLMGFGCQLCGSKVKSQQEFITQARQVHSDKYNYSLVDYKNTHTKIKIICPEHGVFEQTPSSHVIQESGCPACGGRIKLTTDDFIDRSKEINSDKFDYSQTQYINAKTKVKIICSNHGVFEQNPADHIFYHCGCPSCGTTRSKGEIKLSEYIYNQYILVK